MPVRMRAWICPDDNYDYHAETHNYYNHRPFMQRVPGRHGVRIKEFCGPGLRMLDEVFGPSGSLLRGMRAGIPPDDYYDA